MAKRQNYIDLGLWLKNKRISMDIKSWDVSLASGIMPEEISRVERGIKRATLEILIAYATAFNMRIEELLSEYRLRTGKVLETEFKFKSIRDRT